MRDMGSSPEWEPEALPVTDRRVALVLDMECWVGGVKVLSTSGLGGGGGDTVMYVYRAFT